VEWTLTCSKPKKICYGTISRTFLAWRMAMFKTSIMLADEIEPPRSQPMRPRRIFLIALGLFLVPLAVETAAICYSQWCEVLGRASELRTPIIDSITQGLGDAHDSLADCVGPRWHAAIRNPSIALPVSSVLVVLAIAMLRR
jgi:hypothetical protein